jgi:DNA-binding HxlR family transcriptional regulator
VTSNAARRSGCPISISLEIFGDRWSLLIVRDLMFKEARTFRDFANAGESIATNILADRLERLATAGIIQSSGDSTDGRRITYSLTQKGMDLAPVLVEMVCWAARHEDTDAPAEMLRAMENRRTFIDALWKNWTGPTSHAMASAKSARGRKQRKRPR